MHWYEKAHNPEVVTSVFHEPPNLDQLRLFAIRLSLRNREASLYFELPRFPDQPTLRWEGKGFTHVEAQIDFFGIADFKVSSSEIDATVSIQIENLSPERMLYRAKGADCEVRFTFTAFRIAHLIGV